MQNPVKIDVTFIPAEDVQNLTMAVLNSARIFFRDPKNLKGFEEWKARGEHKKYLRA